MHKSAFIEAINKNPSDIELREAYADWLEENGEPTIGWRRINQAKKTCNKSTNGWHWYYKIFSDSGIGPVCEIIGLEGGLWKAFKTAFDALSAAANVAECTIIPIHHIPQVEKID